MRKRLGPRQCEEPGCQTVWQAWPQGCPRGCPFFVWSRRWSRTAQDGQQIVPLLSSMAPQNAKRWPQRRPGVQTKRANSTMGLNTRAPDKPHGRALCTTEVQVQVQIWCDGKICHQGFKAVARTNVAGSHKTVPQLVGIDAKKIAPVRFPGLVRIGSQFQNITHNFENNPLRGPLWLIMCSMCCDLDVDNRAGGSVEATQPGPPNSACEVAARWSPNTQTILYYSRFMSFCS